MGAEHILVVETAEAGRRLDVLLAERFALSRAEVRRLLREGLVTLDGRVAGPRAKGRTLVAGTEIALSRLAPAKDLRVCPDPDLPLVVRARGAGWIAVDKPPGVAVHPLSEEERGSLLGAVVARHPEVQGVGEGGLRSGVVHRLDRDTSGILLVATEQRAWELLRAALRTHRVDKRYRAIVHGRPGRNGRQELWLRVARHRPARVVVLQHGEGRRGARLARLSWRRLESFEDAALVEVHLVTGFLHQIRASFAHLGHPVVGDSRYGPGRDPIGAPRQMLHAARIRCGTIEAESPDPADFTALLARLRRGAA